MSLNQLSVSVQVAGGGKISDSVNLITQVANFGSGTLPAKNLTFAYGTGANAGAPTTINANCWYLAQRTLAGTTLDTLNLSTLLDAEGNALNMLFVRYLLVQIVAPDGVKHLEVGPRGITNPFIGPWLGGQGVTVYDDCYWCTEWCNPFAGWTVTPATGMNLGIYNPTATSTTYAIWIIGEH